MFVFLVWLIAVSIMSSRFIHVVTNGSISFFLKETEQYSIICVYHIFFSVLLSNGHLGYFYILTIMKNAAVNMGIQTSL